MSQSKSFWEHPIEKLEEALSIRKQIAALQNKLSSLFRSDDGEQPKASATGRKTGRRMMSVAARAKIAAAQRARWAKSKGTASSARATKAPKKKGLTPEGRARLAAAMKARWAARKKGAPALNASAKSATAKKVKRTMSPEARAKIAAAAKKRWAAIKAK